MGRVEIRAVRVEDSDEVQSLADYLTLGVAAWRDANAVAEAVQSWVSDSLEQTLAGDARRALFVAEDGGRIVGFAAVSLRRHFSGALDAYLGEMVVTREYWGRSVGAELLKSVEGWAQELGVRFLTLETGSSNGRALAFYAKAGFEWEDIRLAKRIG